MSHYTEIKTQFNNKETLVNALLEAGFTRDQIEVHDEAVPIYDYQNRRTNYRFKDHGDARFAQGDQAHVIVRRKHMGGSHNDFGVYVDPNGESIMFLCDYARACGGSNCANPVAREKGGYGGQWLDDLKDEYAAQTIEKQIRASGKTPYRVKKGNQIKIYAGVR